MIVIETWEMKFVTLRERKKKKELNIPMAMKKRGEEEEEVKESKFANI